MGLAVDFDSCCSNFRDFLQSEVNPNFGDQLSILSAVAPIFGIFFQSEVNPNFRDQLSILSAVAPFFGDFFF